MGVACNFPVPPEWDRNVKGIELRFMLGEEGVFSDVEFMINGDQTETESCFSMQDTSWEAF